MDGLASAYISVGRYADAIPLKWRVHKRQAEVVVNQDFIVVTTHSGRGLTFADPDTERILIAADATDELLGASVLLALSRSRVVPDGEFQQIFNSGIVQAKHAVWTAEIMKRFHYKTKKAMYKGMLYCSVALTPEELRISPWYRDKSYHWTGLPPELNVMLPPDSQAASIGAGVRLALTRCT